ncbi:MAG: extracellular solute-binding protein [Chloroflexota bacterium]|nr:extracellular solute-binding protein [Chloroflexota bacterium]
MKPRQQLPDCLFGPLPGPCKPLLESFIEDSGTDIQVKYAGSSSIAATILEESENSPADVVFLQDSEYLGNLAHVGMLAKLSDGPLAKVDSGCRPTNGDWVDTSGRSRTVVYNTTAIDPDSKLPDSVLDFMEPEWQGRAGWAPLNAFFQAFLTAFRLKWGEEAARAWL